MEWNERLISLPSPKRRSLSQTFYRDSYRTHLQGLIENQPIRLLDIGLVLAFPTYQ